MKRSVSAPLWAMAAFSYFFLVAIPSAHAYVDPGTGSYIFQVVIGAALGAAVAVKLFWRRVWAFIARKPRPGGPPSAPTQAAPADGAPVEKEH